MHRIVLVRHAIIRTMPVKKQPGATAGKKETPKAKKCAHSTEMRDSVLKQLAIAETGIDFAIVCMGQTLPSSRFSALLIQTSFIVFLERVNNMHRIAFELYFHLFNTYTFANMCHSLPSRACRDKAAYECRKSLAGGLERHRTQGSRRRLAWQLRSSFHQLLEQ